MVKSTKGKKVKEGKGSRTSNQITVPALHRLLSTAGAVRIGGDVYDTLRVILNNRLTEIVGNTVIITEYFRRKTIKTSDLEDALRIDGIFLAAGLNPNAKTTPSLQSSNSKGKSVPRTHKKEGGHRFRPGVVAARNVKYQQKNSNCLRIPIANFKRLVKTIMFDLGAQDLRIARGFIELLQLVCEQYIIEIAEKANLLASYTDRETIYAKDVNFVLDNFVNV